MNVLVTYGRRPPYPPLGEHLVKAFRRVGHPAMLLCVRDRPWWGAARKRLVPRRWKYQWQQDPVGWANQRLLKTVERYRPDVLIEIGGDLLTASTLRAIQRRWGTRLGVWLTEGPMLDPSRLGVAEYDTIVSTSEVAVQQLHAAGFPHATYLPFATDPEYFHPSTRRAPQRHSLGFIGSYSPRRASVLGTVTDLGLSIWGTEWDMTGSGASFQSVLRTSRGVFGPALVRCYQSCRLVVSVQREHMTTLTPTGSCLGTGLGFRHFDVPACGSLLLSEQIVELPQAFEVGREVETFSSPEELRDKTRYLLTHDTHRVAMGQRARERVLREHTYLHRVQRWMAWFEQHRSRPQ